MKIEDVKEFCKKDAELNDYLINLIEAACKLEKKSNEIMLIKANGPAPIKKDDYKQLGQLLTDFLESRSCFEEECKKRGVEELPFLGSHTISMLRRNT